MCGLKGLRTFLALPFPTPRWPICHLSNKVIHNLLPGMKKLRVLSLSNYQNITELPNSIGNLIYLRYMNLSHTGIKRLPSVLCNLYNLQTLLLSNCESLNELPEDMRRLVNLRHLDISGTHLREMPIQLARLENLQTLSGFVVSKQQDGLKVAELGKFPHLQGKLSISGLQNVTNPYAALQTNLKTKKQIDELTLAWDGSTATADGLEIERLVLEKLEPSRNLKILVITNYLRSHLPNLVTYFFIWQHGLFLHLRLSSLFFAATTWIVT